MKRAEKVFIIKNSLKQVSIDCLKVAHLPASSYFSANVSPPNHSFFPSAITSRSGTFVKAADRFLD